MNNASIAATETAIVAKLADVNTLADGGQDSGLWRWIVAIGLTRALVGGGCSGCGCGG